MYAVKTGHVVGINGGSRLVLMVGCSLLADIFKKRRLVLHKAMAHHRACELEVTGSSTLCTILVVRLHTAFE